MRTLQNWFFELLLFSESTYALHGAVVIHVVIQVRPWAPGYIMHHAQICLNMYCYIKCMMLKLRVPTTNDAPMSVNRSPLPGWHACSAAHTMRYSMCNDSA
jgi:hypothetical protein